MSDYSPPDSPARYNDDYDDMVHSSYIEAMNAYEYKSFCVAHSYRDRYSPGARNEAYLLAEHGFRCVQEITNRDFNYLSRAECSGTLEREPYYKGDLRGMQISESERQRLMAGEKAHVMVCSDAQVLSELPPLYFAVTGMEDSCYIIEPILLPYGKDE